MQNISRFYYANFSIGGQSGFTRLCTSFGFSHSSISARHRALRWIVCVVQCGSGGCQWAFRFGCRCTMLGSRGAPTLVGFVPNDHIFFSYKRGFFPNSFIWFLSMFLASIADPLELAFSFFPPMILASF
jgi:hypothetical protein